MAFNPLINAVQLLQNFGFFQVILPMLLIFAVFYGILIKTKIFGDDPDKHNVKGIIAIISFAAAFFVVTSTPVVEAINNFLPQASFLLVIVMLILMVFAFLGFDTAKHFGEPKKKWPIIVVIVLVVIFLGIIDASSANINIPGIHELMLALSGQPLNIPAIDQESAVMIITIAIMIILPIIVIVLVTRTKSKP